MNKAYLHVSYKQFMIACEFIKSYIELRMREIDIALRSAFLTTIVWGAGPI